MNEITVGSIVRTTTGITGRVLRIVKINQVKFYRLARLAEIKGSFHETGQLAFVADGEISHLRGLAQPAVTEPTADTLNAAFDAAFDKAARSRAFWRETRAGTERDLYVWGDDVLLSVRHAGGKLGLYKFQRGYYTRRIQPIYYGSVDDMADVIAAGIEAARAEIQAMKRAPVAMTELAAGDVFVEQHGTAQYLVIATTPTLYALPMTDLNAPARPFDALAWRCVEVVSRNHALPDWTKEALAKIAS